MWTGNFYRDADQIRDFEIFLNKVTLTQTDSSQFSSEFWGNSRAELTDRRRERDVDWKSSSDVVHESEE